MSRRISHCGHRPIECLESRLLLSGSGLQGAYYNGDHFDALVGTRTDAQVNFIWGTGSPMTGVNSDHFTTRWTGKIQAQHTESYTFYVKVDDGVRLWVNGQLLLDKWIRNNTEYTSAPIALVAGQQYDIKMDYWEDTSGATAQLRWSSASTPKDLIPTSQLYLPTGNGTGLRGDYYTGTADGANWNDLVTSRTDPAINFSWGAGSPATGVAADYFSTRWTGQIEAPSSEAYTFYAKVDDGVRLWVNNQLIIDKWFRNNTEYTSTPITLSAGQKYDIRMDYFESASGATAQLSWSSASQPKALIPQDRLYANTSPTAALTSPAPNQSFPSGSNVTLTANPADADGSISSVEFYEGTTLIGQATGSPWQFTWNTPAPGNHTVVARAIDNRGAATDSAPVSFTINAVLGTGTGLNAGYYNGTNFDTLRTTQVDPTVNFTRQVGVWPPNNVQWDNWSARWTGQIQPQYSQAYTFYLTSDDGSRLWINGQPIISDWTSHAAKENSATITLTAGQKYDFVLEYFNGTGSASVKLEWSSPSQPRQIVPAAQLYPATGINLPPSVALTSPANLSSFTEPSDLSITASASDDNSINRVEFYVDGTLISTDTTAPYSYTWTGRTDAQYLLTARAYDNAGAWSESPIVESDVYKILPGPSTFVIGVWGQPARNTDYSPAHTPQDWANMGINTMLGYDWGQQHTGTVEDWLTAVSGTGMQTIRQWRNAWASGATYAPGDQVQHLYKPLDPNNPTRDIVDRQWTALLPNTATGASEPGVGANWQTYWVESAATQGRLISDQTTSLAADDADPALNAWMQSDEPDLNDYPTPEQIQPAYQMMKAADPTRPVYVNFAGPRLDDATRKSIYLAYMHSADWLGEDSYPINNNQPLSVIATRADLLEQYSAGKPHFTFIETSWQHLKDKNGNVIGRSPTAYEVRAETWLAIIHGAQGIFYFPQRVDSTFRYEYIPSDSRDPDNMSAPSGGSEFDVRAMIQSQNTLLAQESNWLVNASAGGVLSGLPTGLQGIWRTYDGTTRQYILNTTTGSISYDGQTYGKYEMRITQGAPGGQQAQMAAPQTLTLSSSTAFTSANLLSIDNPFAAMPHHPAFALPIAAWQTQDHWDALLTPSSLTDRLGIAGQHRKDPAAGDLGGLY